MPTVIQALPRPHSARAKLCRPSNVQPWNHRPELRIGEIARVHEELALGLVDEAALAGRLAVRGQEQRHHEQRVVPQLVVVDPVRDVVLEAAFGRARHVFHHALRPVVQARCRSATGARAASTR